ncbi:MAG: OmpP1/FadL family transporter [Thiobacillus sp.]
MAPLTLNRLTIGLILAGFTGLTHAAGFALIEQNASGLGNAFAGQAASAQDASTIFFNPAGMSLLPESQLVVVGSLIKPSVNFTGAVTPNIGGGDGGDAGSLALVPASYYAHRLTPDVNLGIGVNAPFGLQTKYDSGWKGRTQAIKSKLETINVNPAIAWRASETLSVGAGLNLQYVRADLTNFAGALGTAKIKGDDYGWGFNLGALWQPTPDTRIGLAYRSEIDYKLEGDATFSANAAANADITADLTMPASASLSLFQRLSPQFDLLADLTWTGWSSFDELRIKCASNSVVCVNGATLSSTAENWDSKMRYSVGVNYHMNDAWILRSGIAYDKTPVSDMYRTARVPDQSRLWLALGAQYRMSQKDAIDVGYAHLFMDDASINKTEGSTPITLKGNYKSSVDILSMQYTHNF